MIIIVEHSESAQKELRYLHNFVMAVQRPKKEVPQTSYQVIRSDQKMSKIIKAAAGAVEHSHSRNRLIEFHAAGLKAMFIDVDSSIKIDERHISWHGPRCLDRPL